MRVPTPNVSLVELVFCTKNLTINKINDAFSKASKKKLKNVLKLQKKNLFQLILIIIQSAIVDLSLTNVIGKIWEKFLLGMIMNGAFQTECVI